jgi:hypothetical protein
MSNPTMVRGSKYLLDKFDEVIKEVLKDYKPFIVPLGTVNGVELYQINGDDTFCYVTDKAGAIEADKALRKAAEEYTYKKRIKNVKYKKRQRG